MEYSKEILFCTDILWFPLLKFRVGLFIKRLLDIQLFNVELSGLEKTVGYFCFIDIKNFFVFYTYVNYWNDFRTGISCFISKLHHYLCINIDLLGLEYQLVFSFPFLKREVINEV